MYIVQVTPQNELHSEISLNKKGFKVLIPKLKRLERRKGKWNELERLIFPSYVFIDVAELNDSDYYKIKQDDFTLRFLEENGKPYRLSAEEEEVIRTFDDLDGILKFEEVFLFQKFNFQGKDMQIMLIDKRQKRLKVKFEIGENSHYITLSYVLSSEKEKEIKREE